MQIDLSTVPDSVLTEEITQRSHINMLDVYADADIISEVRNRDLESHFCYDCCYNRNDEELEDKLRNIESDLTELVLVAKLKPLDFENKAKRFFGELLWNRPLRKLLKSSDIPSMSVAKVALHFMPDTPKAIPSTHCRLQFALGEIHILGKPDMLLQKHDTIFATQLCCLVKRK